MRVWIRKLIHSCVFDICRHVLRKSTRHWSITGERKTYWGAHVSIENKRHMRELKGVVSPNTPLEWPKDSQKHDLDLWDSSQVSRENYAQKYKLTKVHAACTLLNWPPESKNLRSKVVIEQDRFRNELYKLALWLVKTTLISTIWSRSPHREHQGFSFLVDIIMKTKRF